MASALSTVVGHEPLTYERHMLKRSYFRDLTLAEYRGDNAAKQRLQDHAREMAVELPRLQKRLEVRSRATIDMPFEYRVNPNRLDGQGGYFAPPLWMNELFATAPRAGRVFANAIPSFPLPFGVSSVNLPRLTTGTLTTVANDLAAAGGRDIVDAQSSSPAVPIAGQADVSMQLLEQSPAGAHLDWALFKDLSADYDLQLETMLLNGSGTNGACTGVLQLSGTNSVTYTSASPTATAMFAYLGQAVAEIGDKRKLPPEAWLMTTSRMAWLGSSEDTQNRPLMLCNRNGAGQIDLLSFPILLSDVMPATQGTGANQDSIVACRPSDSILLETDQRTSVDQEVLSGTLGARIQLHGYAAAIHRYPTAVSVCGGSGFAVASSF